MSKEIKLKGCGYTATYDHCSDDICVCNDNCFGYEFTYFDKQDLLDMLALFEEEKIDDSDH